MNKRMDERRQWWRSCQATWEIEKCMRERFVSEGLGLEGRGSSRENEEEIKRHWALRCFPSHWRDWRLGEVLGGRGLPFSVAEWRVSNWTKLHFGGKARFFCLRGSRQGRKTETGDVVQRRMVDVIPCGIRIRIRVGMVRRGRLREIWKLPHQVTLPAGLKASVKDETPEVVWKRKYVWKEEIFPSLWYVYLHTLIVC